MNSDILTSVTESDQQQIDSKKHTPIATPVESPSATSTLSSASSSSSSSSSPLDSPVKGSKKHPISLFLADEDSLQQHNVDSLDHPELLIDVPSSTSDPTVMISEASPNQSPPIQVMEREEVSPAPYRIPSTVFARSPSATPVEWSVQSNESLFSIHMGNNSFSADQIFLMGRSGELGMPGDYNNFLDLKKDPPSNPNSPSPVSTPGNKVEESLNAEDAAAASNTMNEVSRVSVDDQNTEKTPPVDSARHSSSISYRSDESGASVVSFAFPILTSAEGGRAPSTKVETEHPLHQVKEKSNEQQEEQEQVSQQPQPNTPTTPNATGANDRKWFSCFSCCSFCS